MGLRKSQPTPSPVCTQFQNVSLSADEYLAAVASLMEEKTLSCTLTFTKMFKFEKNFGFGVHNFGWLGKRNFSRALVFPKIPKIVHQRRKGELSIEVALSKMKKILFTQVTISETMPGEGPTPLRKRKSLKFFSQYRPLPS